MLYDIFYLYLRFMVNEFIVYKKLKQRYIEKIFS